MGAYPRGHLTHGPLLLISLSFSLLFFFVAFRFGPIDAVRSFAFGVDFPRINCVAAKLPFPLLRNCLSEAAVSVCAHRGHLVALRVDSAGAAFSARAAEITHLLQTFIASCKAKERSTNPNYGQLHQQSYERVENGARARRSSADLQTALFCREHTTLYVCAAHVLHTIKRCPSTDFRHNVSRPTRTGRKNMQRRPTLTHFANPGAPCKASVCIYHFEQGWCHFGDHCNRCHHPSHEGADVERAMEKFLHPRRLQPRGPDAVDPSHDNVDQGRGPPAPAAASPPQLSSESSTTPAIPSLRPPPPPPHRRRPHRLRLRPRRCQGAGSPLVGPLP